VAGELAHDARALAARVVAPLPPRLVRDGVGTEAVGVRHGRRLDDATMGADAVSDERSAIINEVHLHGRSAGFPGGPRLPGTRGATNGPEETLVDPVRRGGARALGDSVDSLRAASPGEAEASGRVVSPSPRATRREEW